MINIFSRRKHLNSKEYVEILERLSVLSVKIESLDIELKLYVKKLRASKGFKDLTENKDLKDLDSLKKKGGIIKPAEYKKYGFNR